MSARDTCIQGLTPEADVLTRGCPERLYRGLRHCGLWDYCEDDDPVLSEYTLPDGSIVREVVQDILSCDCGDCNFVFLHLESDSDIIGCSIWSQEEMDAITNHYAKIVTMTEEAHRKECNLP